MFDSLLRQQSILLAQKINDRWYSVAQYTCANQVTCRFRFGPFCYFCSETSSVVDRTSEILRQKPSLLKRRIILMSMCRGRVDQTRTGFGSDM